VTLSIRTRFAFSVGANLLKAMVGFATGMLVARGLGPDQYGKMMFLIGTFIAARGLLDVGSSSAFFTFLSQRQRSRRFVTWFSIWLGVQFLVPFLAVGLLFPSAWVEIIWKGEQRSLAVMAFVAVYLQSVLWAVMMQMGESQRLTRWVQGVALATTSLHLVLMAISWWQDWLGIRLIFTAMIIEWGLAIGVIARQLRFPDMPDEKENFNVILKEFGRYCLPLIPYSWLGFAYEFADRWLLQHYGGSIQQAFYSIAYQFGAVAAIATSSILNVFWKEIAEAHHRGDKERVTVLYRRVTRGLFFVAASVAGFLVPWSESILLLTLGPAYVAGATALAIMFLYPMPQSMGQIGGTMLFAIGRVNLQVILGLSFMASSMVASYFILAPATELIPGFGLESVGLASKMVVMAVLSVNITAYFLAKDMGIRFDWIYQPISGFGCLGAGWAAYILTHWLFDEAAYNLILKMCVSGIFYLPILFAVIWFVPSLMGVNRDDIRRIVHRVINPKLNSGT